MVKRKKIRTKGKLRLGRYFQEFENGEHVAIVIEQSEQPSFPKRLQGRTGVVVNKRGRAYFVKIKEQNKEKNFLINAIHLKKIIP